MPINPFSVFSFSKKSKNNNLPFKDYYTAWFNTLKNHLLPLLHHSLTSPSNTTTALLSSHLHLLLHHLLSYYESLDLAAESNIFNIPFLLYPPWKTPLERPFLFLGDLHPYAFTNLIRSFLDDQENDDDDYDDGGFKIDSKKLGSFDRPWPVVMAWKEPSKSLMIKIEQIECGLRLMVPALVDRAKKEQAGFVGRIVEGYVSCEGKKERVDVEGSMKVQLEELVSVFVDANRLRRSVISEIVAALNVYQGALFLEGLAQFLVGFNDSHLLREFERCKTLISG